MSAPRPLFACLLALAACGGPPMPTEDPSARALTRDIARVVDTRDQLGWFIDELEIREALPDALTSVCRTRPQHRRAAMAWLDAHVKAIGGDPEAAWRAHGKDLDAVAELMLYHRARALLRRADQWAAEGRCPFWLEPQEVFEAQQAAHGHLFFGAETGGRAYAQWEGGQAGQGGGGELRLFLGWGRSETMTIIGGVEVGGMGLFTDVDLGERLEVPGVILSASAPLALRLQGLSRHVDLEVAPLMYVDQLQASARWGGRASVGVGLSYLRVRWLLPTVTFAVSYDLLPEALNDEAPTVHRISAGLRAGFNLLL